ncbi:hypothetical protein DEAC_c31780 [Desulfosporosinus acididurans]|uniref:Uncharacterized protein n=1 Tax=Desulfosporosinus acididurans TaxID=476652 RepID=A0A0J1FMZ6_9FIRM|nr:hypothetical protein [Desulfosporosinus acididurans]KLU64850.1 hypothetical protein DEAC_c31780 [Desulfosporosinus acididurans]
MKPLAVLKQDLVIRVNQVMEEYFSKIEELETRLLEKDEEINRLSSSLSEMTTNYEIIKTADTEKSVEISRLQRELQTLKLCESGEPELIIIYQPQDIFNYPRNIIRWYFNELDLTKLTFDNLVVSLKGLIDLLDCEMIDEFLFYINDNRLNSLREGELVELISLLELYLQAQFKKGIFSSAGIFSMINSIYKQGWIALLKDFFETNHSYLEESIFKIDASSFDFEEPLTLLRIYFDLKLHTKAEAWLKEIFHSMVLDKELESKDAIELLYFGLVYELEDKALIFIPEIRTLMNNSMLPELKAFKVYYDSFSSGCGVEKTVQELSILQREARSLSTPLKLRGFEEMVSRLKSLQKKELQQEIKTQLATKLQSSLKEESQSKLSLLKKFQSVVEIKNGLNYCPYDNTHLKAIEALLAKYADSGKNVVSQYIPVQLFYCAACNKAFINRSLENKLIPLVSLTQLDIIQYSPVTKTTTSHKKVNQSLGAPIVNSNFQVSVSPPAPLPNSHYGEKWQEESPLKKLGYSTNLTRRDRWDVLIHRAVPKLGYERVAEYLNWFIEDKQKIKQKDFSRAISIWEDDLRRLNEHRANEILRQG